MQVTGISVNDGEVWLSYLQQGPFEHFPRPVSFNLSDHIRTIIRQEIEADCERQRQKLLAGALYHGNGNWSAMNRPAMAAEYDVRPDLPSHSHTVVACPLGNIHCSYHRQASLTVAASEDAA